MQTWRKVVSDIVNDLKSYNLDDRFSYRFLANKFMGRAESVFKQDISDRALLTINDIWKPLHHIELEDSSFDIFSIVYDGDEQLKRSKKRIPETYATKYGNLLKILNINSSMEYKEVKPSQYKDKVNREFVNKRIKYYWISDGYLYIPDSFVEEVKGFGVFKDSQAVDLFNGVIDCCYKPLDSIVTLPAYIIDIAKKDVVSDLMQSNKAINSDENPNQNQNQK